MKIDNVTFRDFVPVPTKGSASIDMKKSVQAHDALGKPVYDIEQDEELVTIRAVEIDGSLSKKYVDVPIANVAYWLGVDEGVPAKAPEPKPESKSTTAVGPKGVRP